MRGKRKFIGFMVATGASVVGFVFYLYHPVDVDAIKTYLMAIAFISAGFFGFNYGEHREAAKKLLRSDG